MHVSKWRPRLAADSNDYSNVARLWRWTIDLDAGSVTEDQIDDRAGDFGRVNEGRVGLNARYGYLMSLAAKAMPRNPSTGPQFFKYDLRDGARVTHELGPNVRGGEPVFVPGGPGEDDGWVMAICHDEASGRSKLVILDAQNFGARRLRLCTCRTAFRTGRMGAGYRCRFSCRIVPPNEPYLHLAAECRTGSGTPPSSASFRSRKTSRTASRSRRRKGAMRMIGKGHTGP